jgi:hypothetical protein
MYVFVNIYSKGCFYSKKYFPQLSLGVYYFMKFLSYRIRSSIQRVTNHNSLHRGVLLFHKRSYPCCQLGVLSRSHFLVVGPSIRSKSITVLLHDLAYPPIIVAMLSLGSNPQPHPTTHHRYIVPGEEYAAPNQTVASLDLMVNTSLTAQESQYDICC